METLNELVKEHSLPRTAPDGGESALLRKLELMLGARPYPCEREAVNDAIEALAQDYFRSRLEKKYARLSDELFDLKREVALEPSNVLRAENSRIKEIKDVAAVSIPLLAQINYGAPAWSHTGKTTATIHYSSGLGPEKKEIEYRIGADAPPLTMQVKDAAAEAMAYAYEVCAGALRAPALRDYMGRHTKENEAPENIFADWMVPMLKVLWKPTEESMKVTVDARHIRDPDPALLLYFNQDYYLVTTWDVAHEEPFRHYLAEFTQPKQQKLKLPK